MTRRRTRGTCSLAAYLDTAVLLARNEKQGVANRFPRGRCWVNRDHPMLAG